MPYIVDISENLSGPSASNGWVKAADFDYTTYPNMNGWVDASSPDPSMAGFVLFGNWLDGGPAIRTMWHEKVFSGYIPGQAVAFHMHIGWGLDTGPGTVFIGIEGGDGSNPREFAPDNAAEDFWTISGTFNFIRENVLEGIADVNGEVKVKWGAKGYGGSCNLSVGFAGVLEIVRFIPLGNYGYIKQFRGSGTTLTEHPIETEASEFIDNEASQVIYAEPTT